MGTSYIKKVWLLSKLNLVELSTQFARIIKAFNISIE